MFPGMTWKCKLRRATAAARSDTHCMSLIYMRATVARFTSAMEPNSRKSAREKILSAQLENSSRTGQLIS